MNQAELVKYFDHTLLKANATQEEFETLIEQANTYHFFSICIPSSWINFSLQKLSLKVKVCTVVGFPLGYDASVAKEEEAKKALTDGAHEIDMVINISKFLNNEYQVIEEEINKLKKICGNNVLKVIVETAYLSQEQISQICKIINNTGADFFKTSTGFAPSGAQIEDIKLARSILNKEVSIKASGGIRDLSTTLEFINAGAQRIGASASHKIVEELI